MKIAILHDNFPPHSIGGADIVAFTFAKQLQREGHDILVITTARKPSDAGVSVYEGLTVHTIATSYDLRFQAYVSLWNVPVVRKVKKILADFKPDVVHAHNVHGYLSYRSLAVAKKLGSRVVLTCHDVMSFNYQKLTDFINPNDLSVPAIFNYKVSAWRQFRINRYRYNPLRNILIRNALKMYVDQIVAVSDALRQALGDNGIGNATVVHNGIDANEWQEPQEAIDAFKREQGLGESVVLFGGRLTSIKGGGKLLAALSEAVKSCPEVQLLVIGKKDAYAERMLAEAKGLGLGGKVVFTGWIEERALHLAYHAAALVAVPSLCFDSFPTMNLEAFACGKPVIASCFGGSRELVTDGESGYIINPYDVPTFAKKVTGLLADKEKRAQFGAAARARVKEVCSLERQTAKLSRLFVR